MSTESWSDAVQIKIIEQAHLTIHFIGEIWFQIWCQEKLEDNKGVIRIHKSKARQQNGQKKRTNKDLQTKDQVTQIPLKTEGELEG